MSNSSIRQVTPYSHDAILAGFRTRAFATVPFSISPTQVDEAIERFFAFLALPEEQKVPLAYKAISHRRGSRVGYKRSEGDAPGKDVKEFVHYHQSAETHFGDTQKGPREFHALLEAMREIYLAGKQLTHTLVSSLESSRPGITTRFFPEQTDPSFFLRFLKYDLVDSINVGETLAVGHYDIGSITLAIAESTLGLRIGGDEGTEMIPIQHHPGQALVMAGYNLPSELPNLGIMPAWHDVILHADATPTSDAARWAIVMFNDAVGTRSASWEQTHTRRGTQLPLPLSQQRSA